MGYQFAGVFVGLEPYSDDAALNLMGAAREHWPDARVRGIDYPFRGIGIALPNVDSYARYEQALEVRGTMESVLSALSTKYPEATFVFVEADCFGGICEYAGYVCRAGTLRERTDEADTRAQSDSLARLVSHLGVTLAPDQDFEPLVRGYFDRAERK